MSESKKKFPAWAILTIIAVAAAVLLAATNMVTAPVIAENKNAEKAAVYAALMEADTYEALSIPEGVSGVTELVAAKKGDETVGYLVIASSQGYAGPVAMTFAVGLDGKVTGVTVGDSDFVESAGFGSRARDAEYVASFSGLDLLSNGSIDALSGATYTSNAVLADTNAAAAAVAACLNGTAGAITFGGGEETTPAEETTPVEEAAPAGEGITILGYEQDITVYVTFNDDGTVATLSVDADSQTKGLGQECAKDAFTSQFVGKSAPFTLGEDIDAVSHATVTSQAVCDAVNQAAGK